MPSSLDGAFVAAPVPGISTVAVGDEALLVDAAGGVRVPLNPAASLVWACLDGVSPLGEIAADVAEGFRIPIETALADVVATVDGFVDRGIACDAHGPVPQLPEPDPPARPLVDADFALGAAGELAVQIGDTTVGLRTSDPESADILRAILAPALVDVRSEPRLALLSTPDRGRVPGMHFVHLDDGLVFRSASRGRALRALLVFLDSCAPPDPGRISLDAHVLMDPREVVLVGGWFRELLDLAEPRLARHRWRVGPGPRVVVDRERFEIVGGMTRLVLDPEASVRLDELDPLPRDRGILPGARTITRALLVGSEPDSAKLATPSQRLAGLVPLLDTSATGAVAPTDVEWLWGLAQRCETSWIFGLDDQELLAQVLHRSWRNPRKPAPPRR